MEQMTCKVCGCEVVGHGVSLKDIHYHRRCFDVLNEARHSCQSLPQVIIEVDKGAVNAVYSNDTDLSVRILDRDSQTFAEDKELDYYDDLEQMVEVMKQIY